LTQFASDQLFESGYFSYAAIFMIGLLASVMLVIKAIRINGTICFNAIDLSFVAFAVLLSLRWIGTGNSWIYSKAAIAVAIVPIYFFVRQYKQAYHFHWAIVFTGMVQVAVAMLQKTGFLTNINASFQAGGLVGNPNILAMLLLLSLPSAIFIHSTTKPTALKRAIIAYILLALAVITLTKCRSAIVGCIVLGIFFLYKNKRLIVKRSTMLLCAGALGLACSGFVLLNFEKAGSLIGRLLIWQSCLVKIIEKPFLGYGISSFRQVYPEGQRVFLEKNPSPMYLNVADQPQWAYNDFIEFWMEGGLFTALAFLTVLLSVLYYWKAQKRFNISRNNISYLSALIFFILSAFNFAYTAWPVLLVFVVSLAWCARTSNNPIQIRPGRKVNLWLIIALILFSGNVLLGIDAGKNLLFQYQFKNADALPLHGQREFYDRSQERYGLYAPFLFKYAAFLNLEGKKTEALEALLRLNGHARSYQASYQLAGTYLEMNDMKNARVYYEEAIKYLPNRILPRYHLFMIELLDKNYIKADSIRKQIMHLDFKGDTVFINQIKESLWKYNTNEKQNGLIK
jgi:O-antigen ligase